MTVTVGRLPFFASETAGMAIATAATTAINSAVLARVDPILDVIEPSLTHGSVSGA
jgi:hypothetical protein